LPPGEALQINARADAVVRNGKAVMHEAFAVHAGGHPGFPHQVGKSGFEDAGTDAFEHMVGADAIKHHVGNALLVQQLAQQQAGRAATDDRYLGT